MVSKLAVTTLLALAICAPVQQAAAQDAIGGAIVGGVLGGVVGGALGGRGGAAAGAIIGAGTGAAIASQGEPRPGGYRYYNNGCYVEQPGGWVAVSPRYCGMEAQYVAPPPPGLRRHTALHALARAMIRAAARSSAVTAMSVPARKIQVSIGRHPADRLRAALLVDRDVGKIAVGHQDRLPVLTAQRPGLEMDRDRGPADPNQIGMHRDEVADIDGLAKIHRIDRDRDGARIRDLGSKHTAADIHLAEQPAAKDVAIGVGVGRHRQRADAEIAARLGFGA
jgi:hypothetical protein